MTPIEKKVRQSFTDWVLSMEEETPTTEDQKLEKDIENYVEEK